LAAEPAARLSECEPIANVDSLVDTRLLLFGEIHGTSEAPRFVGEVVCHFANKGTSVILALEIPADLQRLVDNFLGSKGSGKVAAMRAIEAHPFWSASLADGRSSIAMRNLLERINELRASGQNVEVALFDGNTNETLGGAEREKKLAANIQSFVQRSGANGKVVVLTGNLHSRATRGLPWNAEFEPAGYLLKELRPVTFDLAHAGGTAWNCTQDGCAVHPARASHLTRLPDAPPLGIYRSSGTPGHDGVYYVGEISPATPVVARTTWDLKK
jgi:hypothetical protein